MLEAAIAITVIASGVLTFLVGPKSGRWWRVPAVIVITAWCLELIRPMLIDEITVHFATCDPVDFEFYACQISGGRLRPANETVYRVDKATQSVFEIGGPLGTRRYAKCSVADRLNWSCKFDDGSGWFDLNGGQFRASYLSEPGEANKRMRATGQVSAIEAWRLWLLRLTSF